VSGPVFDAPPPRGNAIKHGIHPPDVIAMWVADSDFPAPAAVREALAGRVATGWYTYEKVGDAVLDGIRGWLRRRHGWDVPRAAVVPVPGVVPACHAAARALAAPGDAIVVDTPLYPPLLRLPDAVDARTALLAWPDASAGADAGPRLDAAALDRAAAGARVLVLCNPHNPLGHCLRAADLDLVATACEAHDLIVVSDDIWSDLALPGARYLPAGAHPGLAARTVTLMAPSKTFGLTGLGFAFAVVTDPGLRERMEGAWRWHLPFVNDLALAAAEAAYTDCDAWLDAVIERLAANRELLRREAPAALPGAHITLPEAGYLAWLDLRETPFGAAPAEKLLGLARVALSDGAEFGAPGFARLNFACSEERLVEALARLSAAFRA